LKRYGCLTFIKINNVFKFITSRPIWVNLLIALGLFLGLVFLLFGSLDWITQHNNNQVVPEVTGQNVTAAKKMLEDKGFSVEVLDSVFVDTAARLSVLKQSPEGSAKVKAGRTVFLTINRAVAPEVELPSLIGFSFKSAQYYLQSLNLKLGDTTYKPDIARNAVKEMMYNGKPIKPGTRIPMGSTIGFVLGTGLGTESRDVPNLIGMTISEARSYLSGMNLSIGSVVPAEGESVSDTATAFIKKQNPDVFTEPVPGQKIQNKIRSGQMIDIYLSDTRYIRDSTGATIPATP
jgi:hypothetical protein